MSTKKNFEWIPGSPPPALQSHSAAKLRLIKHYLECYFETVIPDPRSDRLRISMIDGFCGGGAFRTSTGEIMPGTSIIMLNAVENAKQSLNRGRRKKLAIDARYYFIDKEKTAIDYLKGEIFRLGYGSCIGKSINLMNGRFEDEYEVIIEDILSKSRSGRSIFLLDQFSYNSVPNNICRKILTKLNKTEIILTFAMDWLVDFMSTERSFQKAVSAIEISESQLKSYLDTRGIKGHRYIAQRLIKDDLRSAIGAEYFTPFFLRSQDAHRDLWLIHLSKHPTARNVMVSSHWAIQNRSLHQGKAGLHMLGFDPHWENTLPLDFEFDGNAEVQIASALRQELPYKIEAMDTHEPITFDAFQRAIVNDTAARIDQIEDALMYLHTEKDIEILTPSGQRKRPDARLKSTDRLQLYRQLRMDFN